MLLTVLPMASGALAIGCDGAGPSEPSAHRDASAAHDGAVSDDAGTQVARSLAVSPTHTCALRKAGLFCWGANFKGQLGTEDTANSDIPMEATVAGPDIVEVAAASGRTCVRRSAGTVACWGANERGQIGDGTRTDSLTPVTAVGIDDAVALAVEESSTCVLRADDGRVACFGHSPGKSPNQGSLLPETIEDLSGVVELRAGTLGSYCARGAEGWIRCWRFEDGKWTPPSVVAALAGARTMAMTAQDELCAVMETSEILCHNLDSGSTVPLDDSTGSLEITGGMLAACARDMEGRWRCWNVLPSMLDTVGSPVIDVPSDVPLVEFALSGFRFCARREDNRVGCANANDTPPTFVVVDGLPD